jgi:lysozyme
MRTGRDGVELIRHFEGCRFDAYKCPAGVWTIGYGHTANVKEGDSVDQEAAEAFLIEDLESV